MEQLFHAVPTELVGRSIGNPFTTIDIERELEEFKKWVSQDNKSKKTKDDIIRYSRYAVYLASPLALQRVFNELSEAKRHHVLKAMSIFCRYLDLKYGTSVFQSFFKNLRQKLGVKWTSGGKRTILINIEQALEAIAIASSIRKEYAAYLAALLVSGLRPIHLRQATWDRVVLEGVVALHKTTQTKRAYYAFFTEGVWQVLKRLRKPWQVKIVSYRREYEYKCLKAIREQIPWFEPYQLRHLHATILMLRHMPKDLINFVQGRAAEDVLMRYYAHLDLRMALKAIREQLNRMLEDIDQKIAEILLPKSH